jgi:L-alanine-DL-glutamate epimerase-like enolase superfamily enzyme
LIGAIIVEIRTHEGITLTGYGMVAEEELPSTCIEHHLADLLLGANALKVELLWDLSFMIARASPLWR